LLCQSFFSYALSLDARAVHRIAQRARECSGVHPSRVSAVLRDRDGGDDGESLRPTREVALRPTREPNAPFVAGPAGPRVAPAPRVAVQRSPTRAIAHRAEPIDPVAINHVPMDVAPLAPANDRPILAMSKNTPEAVVVASFPRDRAAAAVLTLRARGLNATLLREASAGPAGLGRELRRALQRATIVATMLGGIGALIGALTVSSEALVPSLGWLPGPAVGAALCAGVLGALGFALGVLALLFTPSRILSPLVQGNRVLVAVRALEPSSAIVAAIVPFGGTIIAHGA
jgi:hypothetical protein